ncbi:50S ribosomal protein L11 methyltransferase [Anaeromyxobacter paludicola]|uniref:Ribosomal protein L11 methyltransferase n=1 Tax=Anaeromyxobacter paludicola TaxID=2918171 RepID=A0ABN6N8F0_9BACT|nr:50S ribosomal protein L11 methyltransferase [Anaeromyxobacter paludicola]BDG09491.1 ribosomal protein L11 methyltransferase [Anaeromyxobacter paludicola]
MPTYALTATVPAARAEDLSAALFDEGATGVEVRDGEVTPMPGQARPAPGEAILVAFFASADEARAAAGALALEGAVEELPDRDWGEAWKEGLSAFSVGRVFVRPSWVEASVPEGSVEVVLDPGMAFGTGTHPTTSLCLGAIGRFLEARPGASVFDVGTGAGLLAIAARKLGASRVVGSDNDPVAVAVAAENGARNGAPGIEWTGADVPAVAGPFDLVVANILANTLVELAPAIAAQVAPGGRLYLSGILLPQEDEVRAAYLAAGLARAGAEERREGEWSLLALERP